jgi:sugar lactone lactonase YvrE
MSAGSIGGAIAAPSDITLGTDVFAESLSSDRAGNLYVGSIRGGVLRVTPQGKVSPWLAAGAFETRAVFGVLVDERRGTLWLCSNDVSKMGILSPAGPEGSWLKSFDLATAKGKASYRLPGDTAFCNDMAVAKDGTLYLAATGKEVFRLKPGAEALELWVSDPRIQPAKAGGADGIAVGADGHVYVTSVGAGLLFRIAVGKDGAGQVTQLKLSQPLTAPDGFRPIAGNSFALAEGGGRITRVDISGDTAVITPLKQKVNGSPAVTVAGNAVWYLDGQLGWLFDPANRGKTSDATFKVSAVPLQ